jgi:glycosyltransferase involved in cell wall biosynthesis
MWAMRDEPLYYGTIPAKIYEAYAAGTPIVAAQGGECASLLLESGGGIAVNPADTDGFIQAIERLLDDPAAREECSRHARHYAERHFDFDRAVRQHESIFQAVVEQRQ